MGSFIGGLLSGVLLAYAGYIAILFDGDPTLNARFNAFNCAAVALVRDTPPPACRNTTAPTNTPGPPGNPPPWTKG